MPKKKAANSELSDKAVMFIMLALVLGGLLGYYAGKAKTKLSDKYKEDIKAMMRQSGDNMRETGEMMLEAGEMMQESGADNLNEEMVEMGQELEEKALMMMEDGTTLLQTDMEMMK